MGRNDVEPVGLVDDVFDGDVALGVEDVGQTRVGRVGVFESDAFGRVALLVEVDEEDVVPAIREALREIDSNRRLADAALLQGDAYRAWFGHGGGEGRVVVERPRRR